MDQAARESTIKALREQLELSRVQAASLDNDSNRREELREQRDAIQLLLDFLERKKGWL